MTKTPRRKRTAAHRQMGTHAGDPNFMSSLARGLSILQAFDVRGHALSVSQASLITGIPRAAARRCLYTLEALGFVAHFQGRYSLRPKVLTLGFSHLSSLPLPTAAQPLLDRCRDRFHESCSLGVLDGDDVFYLARAETTRIMSISLYVGTRLPAYCTSMGRVLLAHIQEASLEQYLSRVHLVPRTSRTITSIAELRAVLTAVRRMGYAIVDQELELGLRSIAVPVFDRTGSIVASLNAGAQAARVNLKELTHRLLPELKRSAADLQSRL
jgi:IclR family transcriptional regulator, pca regulon regulatory protein